MEGGSSAWNFSLVTHSSRFSSDSAKRSNFNLCLMDGYWRRGSLLVIKVLLILEEAQELTTEDCKM
ncbi:hypothetical protein E2C01_022960 [Portunus trituberculatus]|uniref:Uncharacterized protein n=1 Tax=Portunus trituberculatus TaxID=210409 RepID=A0A5B7EAB0_PORTR|nr:hypothetical protein [Portunus trituberculatus]